LKILKSQRVEHFGGATPIRVEHESEYIFVNGVAVVIGVYKRKTK
jgi:hypothetical protein